MNAIAGATQSPMALREWPEEDGGYAAKAPGQGLDMKKMEAMADKLKGKDPTPEDMAEMMKAMGQVVPDADKQLEAARNNFRFKCQVNVLRRQDCLLVARSPDRDGADGLGTNHNNHRVPVITIAKGTAAAKHDARAHGP